MAKVGVVFSNLGTPQGPTTQDVGRYLAEFLMDPYVIQLPFPLRFLLVRGIIVPFRKSKSTEVYQKVWTEEGSPLLLETKKAALALQKELGDDYQVEVAMRYGSPSFSSAKEKLKACDQIIFFPQYPQYAESTVQTGLDYFYRFFADKEVAVVPPYYQNPVFIESYVQFLKRHFESTPFDHLLMSFHGLPESHLEKTDPTHQHCLKSKQCCEQASAQVLEKCYRAQCIKNAQLLAEGLGLSQDQYTVSFQSRLGRQKWIEPYTEQMYEELIKKDYKKIAVICPGFSVDGLETLEEIAISGKEKFLELGGEQFEYVPCLNDDPGWIRACAKLVKGCQN